MTWNLLLWRWSTDYDAPSKRKKKSLKFGDVTLQFANTGDHPAIGEGAISDFHKAIDDEFGEDENRRPFVFHDLGKCAVVEYPNSVRFQLVPKIANIGRRFGLNAAEF